MVDMNPRPANDKKTRLNPDRRELLSVLAILSSAILIAITIALFAFQSYRVDGESMVNTLRNNDRLIINKLPRTLARLTGNTYIPHRGDIIVFNERNQFGQEFAQSKQLIKRVVGLPADRVVVKNGQITIYNSAKPDGFNPDSNRDWQLSGSVTSGNLDVVLGARQIFVCGDNRSNSLDSRSFGPIDTDQIIGKLMFRFLPLGSSKNF